MSDVDDHELLRRASIELEAAVAAAVEARAAHRRLEDVLEAVLAHTTERVLLVDATGHVVLCSAAAGEAWGATPGAIADELGVPDDARSVPIGSATGSDGTRLVLSTGWAGSGRG
jgi:PAS domain-containing protein